MIGRADLALLLHPLDQPCGGIVADAELALDVAGRGLLRFRHHLHRLAVECGVGGIIVLRRAVEREAAILGLFGDR